MDTFHTFPVHPQPEPLESFSSYLFRLAEANRIRQAGRLFRLIFPGDKRNTNSICDLVPTSWGILSQVSLCSVDRLLETTFHYLVERFLPGKRSSVHRIFLGENVVDYLRFCPECVRTKGYYKLIWRFACVPGCPEHNCYLQDVCPHCRQRIPIFYTPLRMRLCPGCDKQFETATTQPLSDLDSARTRVRFYDLALMLSEQGQDIDLRPQFRLQRQREGLSMEETARLLDIRMASLKGLEAFHKRPVPVFNTFLDYLNILHMTFHDLLALTPPIPNWHELVNMVVQQPCNELAVAADWKEAKLLEQAIDAAQEILQEGNSVTLLPLSEKLGINSADIRCYPGLNSLLQHHKDLHNRQLYQQKEAALLRQVDEILEQLQGEPLSQIKICSYTYLRKGAISKGYPRVWKRICDAVDAYKQTTL